MNILFYFHQRASYAVDWKTLINKDDPDIFLVLVSTKECISQISASDLKIFGNIIQVDHFDFATLQPPMNKVLSQHYKPGDKSAIAVMSEFTMDEAAKLRDHFKTKFNMFGSGVELTELFRNKLKMKEVLAKGNVRLPKYREFDVQAYQTHPNQYLQTLEHFLGYPMFIKPIDGAASIGTAYIRDRSSLEQWCNQSIDSKQRFEIDEFIDGDLYHVDGVIQNNQIKFLFPSRYLHPNADGLSGKPICSMTLSPDSEDYQRLSEFAKETHKHFPEIPDGLFHLEVFKNRENIFIFLELAARPPGAAVPEVYMIRTGGICIRKLHSRLMFGLNVDAELAHLNDSSRRGPYAAMFQIGSPLAGGTVGKIHTPIFSGGKHETKITCNEGDVIKPNINAILHPLVSTIFYNDNYTQLEQDFFSLDEQQIIEIIPASHGLIQSIVDSSVSQSAINYVNRIIDSTISKATHYASGVVRDCPSYWSSSASPTLFHPNSNCLLNVSIPCQIAAPLSVMHIGKS